ncbi:hypothetical protein KVR01_001189 [Diaporthe batatas]|uniref:uncharacterized protein n=1 Tax=Diaporthe batatas TaxID=748121 RepID=UPI001D053DE8|nr:uncharacterized protein KVR01_001189 [Diaporthe batatas]KAG8168440.1 hypothetical protein KVR01_001189 [Diaporthe batatas]
MLGHFAGTQSRSQAPDDENGRAGTEHGLATPITPAHPASQVRHQRPWHVRDYAAEDVTSGGHAQPQPQGIASMDILTHKLSSSHLRLDNGIPAPLSCYPASACSSVASFGPPPEPFLEVAACCPGSSSELPGRHATPSSIASTTESDLTRHSHNNKQDARRLRHKPSSRCLKEAAAISAIQSRVEEMISTSTQCNVYTPSLVPVVPIEADDNVTSHEVVGTILEVDDNPGGDDESELALIDRLLTLRRASGTLGIRKSGFPLYRSSTDTALRCQNLVRNKPRMRRRKVKPNTSLSTTAGEGSQP